MFWEKRFTVTRVFGFSGCVSVSRLLQAWGQYFGFRALAIWGLVFGRWVLVVPDMLGAFSS